MIDMVVFDLGGVVAHFHPERRLAALAMLTGESESTIKARIFDSGLEEQAEQGRYTQEMVLATIANALNYRASPLDLIEAWALAFEPDADVLKQVVSIPTPKALFTNNGPMLDACLDGPLRDVKSAFHHVVCSWHLGVRKPEAEAFRRAADHLGVSSSGLLLLDDSASNVEEAIRQGWSAVQVGAANEVRTALVRHNLSLRDLR